MSLKILLNGCRGRMGREIASLASQCNAEIICAIGTGDSAAEGIKNCDVVIDFSSHEATLPLVKLAALNKKPTVIGTTGHTEAEKKAILTELSIIPAVWAGNYSIGVNVLNYLVEQAALKLGHGYHAEIVEMHHCHKKDAPSGTAEKLIQIIQAAREIPASHVLHGRHGITGERPDNQIGVHSLRGGDVVGDHTVIFAGDGERLELMHKASSRKIFAQGALRAAHWVVGKSAGLFDMRNVLGIGS